ncbi:alpha-protein kinase 2 [Bufo bufo]|uniref:alpha-protein kinase 2 n=1 Tax=Bufo bufo TaxID=8384 RepID=UPI001ABED750|nr:alpha-protein kinase 2 [Bufo bufo]
MEGHPDMISPCVSNAQNTDFPLDPFKTVRELAFLQVQLSSEETLDDTKPDFEGNERYKPIVGSDQSLFILEEDDQVLEISKLRLNSEKSDILILNKQINGYQNGHTNVKPSSRVRCYTGTIDHLYCMSHGSKYCCRAPEPKLVDHRTIDEDFFDDCLNYLECSEIMRDYVNGMWQHVLLGNEPVFLLESDQDDETKVSPDCLNECDRPLSGVTSVNEGSNNTLSVDALTSLCVSHSQPLDVKREFPGDNLKALQPEMVITVGHQEDNTSSLKRKERCKLPLSAIQDERAGIDEESMENSLRGDVSACIKPRTSNPYMELYLVNVLDHSVEGLIAMTENSTGDPLIDDFSKERGTLYQIDTKGPGILEHTEQWDADKPNITSDDDFLQDEDLTQEEPSSGQVESSLIVIEDMDTEGPMNNKEEHTHLIHFLKENIRPPESCVHLAKKSPKTEVNEETQQLEETKICLSESEDVIKYTSDISEGNEATKALVSSEYCPENGNVGYRSQTVNGGLETTDTILEIKDSEHAVIDKGSQMVQNEFQTFDDDAQIPENKLQLEENSSEILKNRSHCESKIVENESQIVDSGPQIIDNASQLELNRSKVDCGSQSGDEASQILDIVSETVIIGAQIVNCASLFEDVGSPAVIFGAHIIDDGSPEEDVTLEIMDIGLQTVVLESPFLENCNFCKKKDDSTDNPQESEILQIIGSPHLVDPTRNSMIGHPLTGENELDLDKMFVLNDPTTHRSPKEQFNDLILKNNTTVEDIKGASGITGDQNVLGHKVKDEINIIKEANQQSSVHNFIKGDCEMSNHISKENFQGDVVKRPLGGCVQKAKSLVKTMAGKDNNKTEMKKVHSLHVKDYIPNSNELSQVHRDPHTIRAGGGAGGGGVGGGSGQAHTSTLDQTNRGVSCSTHLMGSTNLLEKSTENKMVKKKFKSSGKEPIKDSNKEAETLDVNEVFNPDEEKRLKRVNSIEGTVAKDIKKAPQLLHGVQAELFHDRSGNLKLFCRFAEIHADSSITWMKDAKLLARLHRSSKDDSPVSLAIVQVSKKDQGLYNCTLKNAHGKVSTEFHLTAEVLDRLAHSEDVEGGEEIEFNQLFFREDFITDMYFGGNLHGRIATEDLYFGEGVHRKAFRSKVMCGLFPVFNPGHLCVLKVHNSIAYGAKNSDELLQRNYKLAVQECYVQNTAREYAKIYAAEAEQLEEFGNVPEIIPIFLIHRPANNIPYATVEEELIGDFVKYSIKDGKEINVLRKDSEAGQKCCTFQHWVYERTNGNLLVTDMQGVGMKLTDVGIATMGKGYKGFKGNCSVSFIDQFKALHQCNKYCEILSLQSLRPNPSKQKKPNPVKEKPQPNPTSSRKSRQSTKAKKT